MLVIFAYLLVTTVTAGGHVISNLLTSSFVDFHDIQDLDNLVNIEKLFLRQHNNSCGDKHFYCACVSNEASHSFNLIATDRIDNNSFRFILNKHCILLYSTHLLLKQYEEMGYQIEPFLPILKIHHSIVHHLKYQFLQDDNTSFVIDEVSSSRAMVIQFANITFDQVSFFTDNYGRNISTFLSDILISWTFTDINVNTTSCGSDAALPDDRTGKGTWYNLRKDIIAMAGNHPCLLPEQSTVEYEGDFVRIVDLSGFTGPRAGCLVRLVEVAAMDNRVLSVTLEDRPVLLNYAAKGVLQSGTVGIEPYTAAGLTGSGQIVGVADSGLNDLSCFFYDDLKSYSSDTTTRSTMYNIVTESSRRKVIQYIANADGGDTIGGHGTHVCASVVGKSTLSEYSAGNGIVPNAKLVFFDLQVSGSSSVVVPDLYQYVFKSAYDSGVRVYTNSWGSASYGSYSSRSYATDSFTFNYQDMLLVFAAGNVGEEKGLQSIYDPCLSKNVLCVGSTNLRDDLDDSNVEDMEVSYFSSLGPTFDGRIKPDVVAPGFKILSALSGDSTTKNSCGVTEMQGTSMSAPLVAGIAVLVREYFMTKWSSYCRGAYSYCRTFQPSGYLTKAVIIHSGRSVSKYSKSKKYFSEEKENENDDEDVTLSSPPDYYQGYGQVTLTSVLPISSDSNFDLFVYDKLTLSSKSVYLIEVMMTTIGCLKVTLTWYDPPAVIGTVETLLINNLDLILIDADGYKHYGNDVSYQGKSDSKNTVEQITLTTASKGVYSIYITANYISNSNYQTAAVIITSKGYVKSGPTSVASGNVPTATIYHPDYDKNDKTSKTIEKNGYAPPENIFIAKDIKFSEVLSSSQSVCLPSFTVRENMRLTSVDIDFNSNYLSGSDVYLLGIKLMSPSGKMLQFGGDRYWFQTNAIWSRTWPISWPGLSPADFDPHWTARRNVDILGIREEGDWEVCVQIMYESWNPKIYTGTITVNFRVDMGSSSHEYAELSQDTRIFAAAVGGLVFLVTSGIIIFSVIHSIRSSSSSPEARLDLTDKVSSTLNTLTHSIHKIVTDISLHRTMNNNIHTHQVVASEEADLEDTQPKLATTTTTSTSTSWWSRIFGSYFTAKTFQYSFICLNASDAGDRPDSELLQTQASGSCENSASVPSRSASASTTMTTVTANITAKPSAIIFSKQDQQQVGSLPSGHPEQYFNRQQLIIAKKKQQQHQQQLEQQKHQQQPQQQPQQQRPKQQMQPQPQQKQELQEQLQQQPPPQPQRHHQQQQLHLQSNEQQELQGKQQQQQQQQQLTGNWKQKIAQKMAQDYLKTNPNAAIIKDHTHSIIPTNTNTTTSPQQYLSPKVELIDSTGMIGRSPLASMLNNNINITTTTTATTTTTNNNNNNSNNNNNNNNNNSNNNNNKVIKKSIFSNVNQKDTNDEMLQYDTIKSNDNSLGAYPQTRNNPPQNSFNSFIRKVETYHNYQDSQELPVDHYDVAMITTRSNSFDATSNTPPTIASSVNQRIPVPTTPGPNTTTTTSKANQRSPFHVQERTVTATASGFKAKDATTTMNLAHSSTMINTTKRNVLESITTPSNLNFHIDHTIKHVQTDPFVHNRNNKPLIPTPTTSLPLLPVVTTPPTSSEGHTTTILKSQKVVGSDNVTSTQSHQTYPPPRFTHQPRPPNYSSAVTPRQSQTPTTANNNQKSVLSITGLTDVMCDNNHRLDIGNKSLTE